MLISIYTELNLDEKAVKVLDDAILYHKNSGTEMHTLFLYFNLNMFSLGGAGSEKLVQMLRRSARYKLDSGDAKAAAQLLEEIHKTQVWYCFVTVSTVLSAKNMYTNLKMGFLVVHKKIG